MGSLRGMEEEQEKSAPVVESAETGPLLHVCRLLNEAGARYLVAGAYAMILNSAIRATEDVDLLVEKSEDNFRRVIEALSRLADGAAKELTPADFVENVVVKIADEVEVDVSTQAWTVTYEDAVANACEVTVNGTRIPYLSLPDLIRSKQTHRLQDQADVQRLRSML